MYLNTSIVEGCSTFRIYYEINDAQPNRPYLSIAHYGTSISLFFFSLHIHVILYFLIFHI